MPMTKWRGGARLFIKSERSGQAAREIASGQLAEMISLALTQPDADQPRLCVKLEGNGRKLSWEAMKAMSEHPDFPVFI